MPITRSSPSTKYGYAADAFIRLRADDLKSSTPAIHHAVADYECHRTASGADVWVKYFISQTQIAGEALMVHMVISADEDVEAEAKRLEVQQRYSDLLNNMEDYVFGISKTGFFTICNPAFEGYIGQGPLVGKAALAVLDGGTGGAWTEMMANYNQGNQYYAEWYDPGRERWLRITQYQGSDGIGFFASDIGEQKALKHTISQHENTLKAIVNASEDLIWAFDRTYKLLIANKAFKYSTAAMYGMPLSKGASILPETEEGKSTIKHWIAAYERALLGEAVYEILTDKAEDGREIVMDVRLYPIMDDSGMVICVGCFAHDITKRRQHEKHIERQNKQLMEIAWIQSHELRAPLANILGLVQLLRIDGENKSYYEMYLQKLQEASNELDRIIHEVVARSVIPFEQSDSHAPSA